jgi:hypothetical protein
MEQAVHKHKNSFYTPKIKNKYKNMKGYFYKWNKSIIPQWKYIWLLFTADKVVNLL